MSHDKTRRLRRCRVCRGARTRDESRLCGECRRSADDPAEERVRWLVERVMAAVNWERWP